MDYDTIKSWTFPRLTHRYSRDDTILYNLAIGFGADDLDYVWEDRLTAFPTLALVLATPGTWVADPATGIDFGQAVHSEQRLDLFAPLPPDGELFGQARVTHVCDKGPSKGAIIVSENDLTDASGALIARTTQSVFCRGDGGLSASDPSPPSRPALPDRAPDATLSLTLPENAAVLYRLTGDRNPLHVNPKVARAAGFDRPLLHGLCTLGHVARVIAGHTGGDLTQLEARFSAPVFAGDALTVDLWTQPNGVAFRARSATGAVVLNRGFAGFSL